MYILDFYLGDDLLRRKPFDNKDDLLKKIKELIPEDGDRVERILYVDADNLRFVEMEIVMRLENGIPVLDLAARLVTSM